MKWKTMPKQQAEEFLLDYEAGDAPTQFDDTSWQQLREKLVQLWQDADSWGKAQGDNTRLSYLRDVSFGLGIYELFSSEPFKMTPRTAADTGVWRYIAVKVIPDIVTSRWPKRSSWQDRMVAAPRRLYPKVLWWYIYLCWQGGCESTLAAIKGGSEDIIAQLVERAGSGYRLDLSRAIIHRLAAADMTDAARIALFRRVMKLNTARMVTLIPELYAGGIDGYVEDLFGYFSKK